MVFRRELYVIYKFLKVLDKLCRYSLRGVLAISAKGPGTLASVKSVY
jgi:hypothetical protein